MCSEKNHEKLIKKRFMKNKFVVLCCCLAGLVCRSVVGYAQINSTRDDEKLIYPYVYAPSEGLVNKNRKRISERNLFEWLLGLSSSETS